MSYEPVSAIGRQRGGQRYIDIRVNNLDVPAEIVAAAYKDERSVMGVGRARSMPTSKWPLIIFDFVQARTPRRGRRDWTAIFEEFKKEPAHADCPCVKSDNRRSFVQIYFKEERAARPRPAPIRGPLPLHSTCWRAITTVSVGTLARRGGGRGRGVPLPFPGATVPTVRPRPCGGSLELPATREAIFTFTERDSASEMPPCGSEMYPRRRPCSPSSDRCNVGTIGDGDLPTPGQPGLCGRRNRW